MRAKATRRGVLRWDKYVAALHVWNRVGGQLLLAGDEGGLSNTPPHCPFLNENYLNASDVISLQQ